MSLSPESERNVQARAEQLLAEADVVHQSNHDRKEMLEGMMDAKAFDSGGGLDDSMASFRSVETAPPSSATFNTDKDKDKDKDKQAEKRKSRFQTVSELKQQVQDCHKALLTMQENANLKYRKLELQNVELKAALDGAKHDIDSSNSQLQNLEKEKQMLEESLQLAIGKDQADFLSDLKTENGKLLQAMAEMKLERDAANTDKETMRKAMTACSVCSRKIPDQQPPAKVTKGTSFWSSFNQAMKGLTTEAEVTASPQRRRSLLVEKPPAPPDLLFKEQSELIKVELEADIEAMEKQMKDDIEALKSEWTKPSPKSSGRGRRRHHSSKKNGKRTNDNNVSAVVAGFGSLDAFFASASHELNLEDEQMDEERSFYSMSRSVATAPVTGTKKRRKKKKSSSHHRKSSTNDNNSSSNDHSNGDRRGMYSSQSKTIRESFRAQLLGLGDEVSVSGGPIGRRSSLDAQGSDNETGHFDELQREVAEWRGSANHALTVL